MDGKTQMIRSLGMLLGAVLLASNVGCSMFKLAVGTEPRAEVTAGGPTAAPSAKYVMEIYPADKEPMRMERTLDKPITVQQALVESGANKKFKRCNIEIMRQLPGGVNHRMVVDYDRSTKRVSPEFDYNLQANDRILIKEDTTTALDDMFNKAMGPLGGGNERQGRTKSGGYYTVGDK